MDKYEELNKNIPTFTILYQKHEMSEKVSFYSW